MNWIYPNFLRRIDHYLKINYPHVWRTRVHDFGWFSLIKGNLLAIVLGILAVGQSDVLSKGDVTTLHKSLAVLLGFVGLFWVVRLLRFKIKFSDFKTMLTTWVIYVFCLGSLCLNLATFTSSIAFRTAHLYSDDVVQTDYNYLMTVKEIYYDGEKYYSGECQNVEYEKEDYLKMYYAESLKSIVSRHNVNYNGKNNVCHDDIKTAKNGIYLLQEAKKFMKEPILGKNHNHHKKKTFYHELLEASWFMLMLALFFLPASLFLLSVFGVRNLLISALSTLIIFVLIFVAMRMASVPYYSIGRLITSYVFITFILGMTLIMGRHKLRSWNYVAGVFMLMLGVVFFMFYVDAVEMYRSTNVRPLWIIGSILPFSLLTSLIAAWMMAKHNERPVLR